MFSGSKTVTSSEDTSVHGRRWATGRLTKFVIFVFSRTACSNPRKISWALHLLQTDNLRWILISFTLVGLHAITPHLQRESGPLSPMQFSGYCIFGWDFTYWIPVCSSQMLKISGHFLLGTEAVPVNFPLLVLAVCLQCSGEVMPALFIPLVLGTPL